MLILDPWSVRELLCIYVEMGYGDLRGKAFLVHGICISVSLHVFLHNFQEKKSEEELKMRLVS